MNGFSIAVSRNSQGWSLTSHRILVIPNRLACYIIDVIIKRPYLRRKTLFFQYSQINLRFRLTQSHLLRQINAIGGRAHFRVFIGPERGVQTIGIESTTTRCPGHEVYA